MTDSTMTGSKLAGDERAARLAKLTERRAPGDATEVARSTSGEPDPVRAERLARLQQRRSHELAPTAATTELPAIASPPAELPTIRRRRSPAAAAKIITIGASATAMFGMMAGYGIADGLDADAAVQPAPDDDARPIDTASAVPPPAAAPTAPQVLVVVVDGQTGRTLSTTTGTGDLDTDLAAVGITPAASDQLPAGNDTVAPVGTDDRVPAAQTPVVTLAPVPRPAAVELAVPVPPPLPRPAAPAAQSQPAEPQATSDGS